jgi:hypothetical protein
MEVQRVPEGRPWEGVLPAEYQVKAVVGRRKPRSEWTEAARARERYRRRIRFRDRYRYDPEYRADFLVKKRAWEAAKIARCPEYAALAGLRSKVGRLREQVERHQQEIDAIKKDLEPEPHAAVVAIPCGFGSYRQVADLVL